MTDDGRKCPDCYHIRMLHVFAQNTVGDTETTLVTCNVPDCKCYIELKRIRGRDYKVIN